MKTKIVATTLLALLANIAMHAIAETQSTAPANSGLLGSNVAAVAVFDIPPSLLHRMVLAWDVAFSKDLGLSGPFDTFEFSALKARGFQNALEIASRPRGQMMFCDDLLSDKEREELWPFDVEAFEISLESKMIRDKSGRFRLMHKDASGVDSRLLLPMPFDADEKLELSDDVKLEAANPTIRWVNNEIEKWAIAQMDAKFRRLDEKMLIELEGKALTKIYTTTPPHISAGWMLDKGEYFVIEREEDRTWNLRRYIYIVSECILVASFDSFPSRNEAAAMRMHPCAKAGIVRMQPPNISALHNLAVLEWQHRKNRMGMDPFRLKSTFESISKSSEAVENLKVLLGHIPELKDHTGDIDINDQFKRAARSVEAAETVKLLIKESAEFVLMRNRDATVPDVEAQSSAGDNQTCLPKPRTGTIAQTDDAFVIKADGREWRFVAVEGTSQLPLEYMRTGDEPARTNLVSVTMPKFWIAEKMVTEGEFAELMGLKVRDGRAAEQPLADIEWEDALHYCEKFTDKYSKELPANAFASMPTMHEWSHAVNVLEGKLDLSDAVGTFLFTMNQFAGVIVTTGTFESQKDADFDLAVDLGILPKRVSQSFVGLRMVLVSWNGGQLIAGNEHIGNRVLSRGSVLTTYGLWEDAERHLKQAIAKGALSPDDKSRAEGMLEFIGQEHEYDFEDWSGLVSRAAAFAEKKGYAARPYAESWQWLEYEGGKERPVIVSEYGKAGIVGEWIKIGYLPESIKKDQPVGTEGHILIFHNDDQKSFPYTYTVTDSNLVQVLRCDFTGDGIEDMVVEDFLSVGAGGYWYSFYEATEDGGYKKVDSEGMHEGVQLVGLCAIPRIDGKGCGFIVIGKESNPVLTASILSVKDGKFVWDTVTGKSVYMLDAKADAIYMPAPFIGAGYGIGFRLLEGQGTWYRPVFWPWEQGKVQGFEQAQKEAVQLKQKAQKELVKLREKWPHAADRVSQWDMPDYEKRFFEIDKLQDWCGEDKPNRYGKFESLCREAIGMKIEPAIWYYNLACALSVQGKTDDAFDALEQAVVAGYNESYKAKADSDFDNISANPRFSELLAVMDVWDRGNWNAPREYASVSNGVVVLSEDKVYYGFKNHYYSVWLDGLRDTLFYIDRDGQDDSIDDVVTVRFDAIGRSKKRDIGFANLVIGNRPLIARGTCRDGELPSDSLGALGASFSNVLGLYACDDYPFGKLIWCILYRGGAAEGRRLAEIIRDAYRAMPTEERERMLAGGLFAREMTSMIHVSMKPGTDGGVINVSDIDVVKLMSKVDSFRVASLVDSEDTPGQYTVREGDDIIVIAIRLGVSPEDIRKLNGLNPGDVLKPGTVLKIPQ